MKTKLYTPEQAKELHEQFKATAWIIFLFVAGIIVISIYI